MEPDLGYAIQTSIKGSLENIGYLVSIFKCRNCGKCEQLIAEGIWLQPDEILPLADELKLTKQDFIAQYCFSQGDKVVLKTPCIFYKENKCSVYPVRPIVCRLFPIDINFENHRVKIICCPGGIELLTRLNINPDLPVTGRASSPHVLPNSINQDFRIR